MNFEKATKRLDWIKKSISYIGNNDLIDCINVLTI